jgi:hypothetical protein
MLAMMWMEQEELLLMAGRNATDKATWEASLAMHTKLNKLFPYDSPTMLFGILPKN